MRDLHGGDAARRENLHHPLQRKPHFPYELLGRLAKSLSEMSDMPPGAHVKG